MPSIFLIEYFDGDVTQIITYRPTQADAEAFLEIYNLNRHGELGTYRELFYF